MLCTTIVLNGDSTDRFLGLLATLFEEFQPQTPFEESLIENMAVTRWRQMRIWGIEKAGMEHEMRRQSEMSNSTELDPSSAAATRASIAFRTLSDDSRSLELINRYDSRYDRQYYRAHRRFVETRDRRTPPSAPTPQPAPVPAAPPPPPIPQAVPEKTQLPNKPEPHLRPEMRHHVSRLCRAETKPLRRGNVNPLESVTQIGLQHAFPQVALPMSKFLGLILVLWACCSAAAATLQQLSLDQMTQSATAIVRARVTGSSASFTGSTVYTHYRLQISETWKGSPGTEVMLPGGVANGYRQSFPGIPTLQTGTEYVLYLWKSSTTGITHIVGLSQGIFNVTQQADGSIQVSRPEIGETMLDDKGHLARDQAIRMQISAMKSTVIAGASK